MRKDINFATYFGTSLLNIVFMTTAQINEQIRAIEIATERASKTKESALKFLIEAGIILPKKKHTKTKKHTS